MLQHCLLLCGFWWESSDIENVVLCLQHVLYLCPASFKIPFLSLVFSSMTLMCLFVYFQFQLEFLKFLEPEDICLSQKPGSSSHYSFEYFCCLTLSLSSPSGTPRIYILKGFFLISSPWVSAHFEWNSLAFSMIQRMLAIWSLVPLPFLKQVKGPSTHEWIKYYISTQWRIIHP